MYFLFMLIPIYNAVNVFILNHMGCICIFEIVISRKMAFLYFLSITMWN